MINPKSDTRAAIIKERLETFTDSMM